jgi:hypothetical protein
VKPVYRRFPLPSGDQASWHYVEFFAANIRNLNTRRAYARACSGSSAGATITA